MQGCNPLAKSSFPNSPEAMEDPAQAQARTEGITVCPKPRHTDTSNTPEELQPLKLDLKLIISTELPPRSDPPALTPKTHERVSLQAQRGESPRSPGSPAARDTPRSECPVQGCLPTGLWASRGEAVYVLHLLVPSAQHKSNSAHGQRSQKYRPWIQPVCVQIQTPSLFAL